MPTFKSSTSKRSTGRNNKWGASYGSSSWGTGRSTSATSSSTWSVNTPQFKTIKNECQAWMGSYKNIYSQFNGATKTSFSPTVANRFLKLINNGTFVYKFNNTQFVKAFGSAFPGSKTNFVSQFSAPTIAKQIQKKFGTGIKSVARGNGNCWLVAATPNVTSGPFKSYNW